MQERRNSTSTLSSARVAIERAFGMLKCRLRRLKNLDMNRIDLIPEVIMARGILHNICIQNNDSIATDCNEIFDEELQYVADGHTNPEF